LRPVDALARYGGEEFVVLLPGTAVAEAQQALTRLQRSLSASLFMHDKQGSAGDVLGRRHRLPRRRGTGKRAAAGRRGPLRGQAQRQEPHLHR
jgi:GGDEF domain-containing protein